MHDPALLQRQLSQINVDAHLVQPGSSLSPSNENDKGNGAAGSPSREGARVASFELHAVEPDPAQAHADGGAQRVYRATWQPNVAGVLDLRIAEPALAGLDLHRHLEVVAPDDELRQPQPDHARLVRLAEQTGGAVVPLNDLARLRELVPNRDRRIANDVSEPLWNSSLVLIVFLGLLTLEWSVRKAIRLV